jgi:hypothetical protein
VQLCEIAFTVMLSRSSLTVLLVSIGFTLVGVGVLLLLGFGSTSPSNQNFYWIATAVGFALLGLAFGAWLKTLSTTQADPRMRMVFRLFALACLVLGVAYVGLVNELIQLHRQAHHWGLRWQAISDALSMGGFLLAGVGFWIASLVPRSLDAQLLPGEDEPTRSGTAR